MLYLTLSKSLAPIYGVVSVQGSQPHLPPTASLLSALCLPTSFSAYQPHRSGPPRSQCSLSLWIPLPTPPCSVLSLESFCPSYTIYHLTQASVFPGKVFRCPRLATSPPHVFARSELPSYPEPTSLPLPHLSTPPIYLPHPPFVTPGLGHRWMDTSLAFALWGICPLGRAPSITWG